MIMLMWLVFLMFFSSNCDVERVWQNPYSATFTFITSQIRSNAEIDSFFEAFRCSGITFLVKDTLDRGYAPFLKSNCNKYSEALFGLDDFFETQEEMVKNDDLWQLFKKTIPKDLDATYEISFTPVRNRSVSVAIRPIGDCSKGFYETPFLIIDIIFDSDSLSKVECIEISKYGAFHSLNE
jgi:hypothetical protein